MDALREIHKKLAPGGSLGMIWNIEDCGNTVRRTRSLVAMLSCALRRQRSAKLAARHQVGGPAQGDHVDL